MAPWLNHGRTVIISPLTINLEVLETNGLHGCDDNNIKERPQWRVR